jgi:hypothetical protein
MKSNEVRDLRFVWRLYHVPYWQARALQHL